MLIHVLRLEAAAPLHFQPHISRHLRATIHLLPPARCHVQCAGTRIVLLKGASTEESQQEQYHQSLHGSGEALVGELALLAPCLGWSQRLLNRDHYAAYYKVLTHPSTSCIC